MAETRGNKRRLSINLSFLTSNEQTQVNNNSTKSSKKFEKGVVGLGILAAINDMDHTRDPYFTVKSNRAAAILAVSPRSSPIPIFSNSSISKLGGSGDMMELCDEEYTCVISRIGDNLIKKKEYFDGKDLRENCESSSSVKKGGEKCERIWVSSGVFSAFSPPVKGDSPAKGLFGSEDFLSSCYLCKKKLHGLDIFMYRGEKAFCSVECRYKQISTDECKEKCGTGLRKAHEYSVSPCSGTMQFLTGVAAA